MESIHDEMLEEIKKELMDFTKSITNETSMGANQRILMGEPGNMREVVQYRTEMDSARRDEIKRHVLYCIQWRDAIFHWNEGCPEKHLMLPLKYWPLSARKSSRILLSMYFDRKKIAEEQEILGNEAFNQ